MLYKFVLNLKGVYLKQLSFEGGKMTSYKIGFSGRGYNK